ncbi:hypothetical protein QFZ31_003384 [Neobacillus niacini]|nr:hypothetical protein [Neobacillus niacini]
MFNRRFGNVIGTETIKNELGICPSSFFYLRASSYVEI